MLKLKYKKYTVFSPVTVNGQEVFVTRLPKGGDDSFLVSGDSFCHPIEELQPIPLDKAFFERHPDIFKRVNDVYEHYGNSHVVTIDDNSMCLIDGKEYGYVYRHELINILDDLCNCHILLPDIEVNKQTKE